MPSRTSSSSSTTSGSVTQGSSSRARNASETSGDTTHTGSQLRERSPTNTIDGTSIGETATIRSASPSASHMSAQRSRKGADAISITTTQTAGTNVSSASQNAGGIPIIRPPVLQPNPGFVGPQRPAGYPTQPPPTSGIQVDVAAAQQQYQQRSMQQSMSSLSGSSSSSAGSLSSPGGTSIHQQGSAAIHAQANSQAAQQQQQQQQQQQFHNQIPPEHIYNELLGPDAFKDVILDIDYGALGNFNVPFHSGGDFLGGQLPPGISVRPAYTTVDSLNYQQHMFNTARTVYADSDSNSYGAGAYGGNYNVDAGQQFDIAKAIFNQVDANRDGRISQDEFRQWAQGGMQQSYAATANYTNVQSSAGHSSQNATVFDGGNPAVAQILQQSGLGRVVGN